MIVDDSRVEFVNDQFVKEFKTLILDSQNENFVNQKVFTLHKKENDDEEEGESLVE